MNTQPPQNKPASYINIAADINFLQRIMCCNHNMNNGPADTPRTTKHFDFVDENPVKQEDVSEESR